MFKDEITLSNSFKTQTTKAIIAIVLFACIYVVLFLLAIALTAISVYGAYLLVLAIPSIWTLIVAVGLASSGLLVLIFLVKFLFKSHRLDRSHLHEITAEAEPALFALITEVVHSVGTKFPKKVYLSADVNAAVFYDSTFWSMLLPIPKNLQIGLGLVNTTTQEELKAILAHEFGHFSQKTMKVGSYVYQVNQVIFNMLFDNESYDNLVQRWVNISGYFAIFVWLAIPVIRGIQWVLQQMYAFVNRNYLALSREMEFHADEIAAHVTGYEPLQRTLLRMGFADHAFNSVLGHYEGKIASKLQSSNLYQEQTLVMRFLAKEGQIPMRNGLPVVTQEEITKFNKSKLVIKDQWASHPGVEERIDRLSQTGLSVPQSTDDQANELFKDITALQTTLTQKVFEKVPYEGEVTPVALEDFQAAFEQEFQDNSFPKLFNGYYDPKNPLSFELDTVSISDAPASAVDLFSDEKVEWVHQAVALQQDIESIQQIADKQVAIKTFDYDGKKYKQKESPALSVRLQQELVALNSRIRQNDIQIYQFCKQAEQTHAEPPQLASLYRTFFEEDAAYEDKANIYVRLSSELLFVNHTLAPEDIRVHFHQIRPIEETFKSYIREMLEMEIYQPEMTTEIRNNLSQYANHTVQYFGQERYYEDNLGLLFSALHNYIFILTRSFFLLKKKLVTYQETLITEAKLHAS